MDNKPIETTRLIDCTNDEFEDELIDQVYENKESKYKVVKSLGQGGFGKVYLVNDQTDKLEY